MKLKSEAKIGIIVIATILLVIWGINFLKGKNIIRRSDVFYAVYNNVAGLEATSSIYLNGYKVGTVNDVRFDKNSLNSLIVSLAIGKNFSIPQGSVAELYNGLLDGTSIRIIPAKTDIYHTYGDTLLSNIQEGLFTQVQNEIEPLKIRIEKLLISADTLLTSLNEMLDNEGVENIKSGILSLKNTSSALESQLQPGGDLSRTFAEVRKLSETLASNRSQLDTIFSNLASVSDSAAKSNIRQTINNLNQSLSEASILIENINKGEGSLGLLATNDSLYINLQATVKSLNILLEDVNDHPKKYVHFSLFGKKDKSK